MADHDDDARLGQEIAHARLGLLAEDQVARRKRHVRALRVEPVRRPRLGPVARPRLRLTLPGRRLGRVHRLAGLVDRLSREIAGFDVQRLAMDFQQERKALVGEPAGDHEAWIDLHVQRDDPAEARAKIVYERLINFTTDAGTKDALQFLMTREITHMKAFTAALESMNKPRFMIGMIPPTPGLVDQFFNDSTGRGEDAEVDARGPWNQGEEWQFVEAPACGEDDRCPDVNSTPAPRRPR